MRNMRFATACAWLLALVCLTGCPAIPFIANDERSVSQQYSDKQIEGSIKTDLLAEHALKATDINVYSFRGHVYLIGQVDLAYRAFAERTARESEGVRVVTTHWFPEGTENSVSDAQIEAAIDTNLLFAKNVSSTQVNVDVWGGNVVLVGIMASQADIDRAITEARQVSGVKSVRSYLMTNRQSLQESGQIAKPREPETSKPQEPATTGPVDI